MFKIQADKKKHFGYSFIIAFLCGLIAWGIRMNPLEIFYSGFGIAMAAGVGKEYGDKLSPSNRWDWYDVLADTLGSLAGIGIILILALVI